MLVRETKPFHRVTNNMQQMTMQEYTLFLQHFGIPGVVQWHQCMKVFVVNGLSLLVPPEKQSTTQTLHPPRPVTYNTAPHICIN